MYVCIHQVTVCTKVSLVLNELELGKPFVLFLATRDLFSVLEMHLRYTRARRT